MSKANIAFLQQEGRKYIIGTLKESLRNYEQELLNGGWKEIREGVEGKLSPDAQWRRDVYSLPQPYT